MAFSSTLIKRWNDGEGNIYEGYTFDGDSVTTGTITPQTSDDEGIGLIKEIDEWGGTDDDTAGGLSVTFASNLARSAAVLTFTSGDTGYFWLKGRAR